MYYHVHDGINVWSKFNGHRCYSDHTPYYNVLHEAISYCFHGTERCTKKLTCYCMTRHGTRPVGKVSDLYYFTIFEIQGFKATTTRALKCKTLGVVCVPKSGIIRQGRVMRMLDKIIYWVGSCNPY